MRTAGVDLAAEAAGTAVAGLEWSPGRAAVKELAVGADDATLIAAISRAGKTGIDCPLGWPEPFTEFVGAHRTGSVTIPAGMAGIDWRRRLVYRRTDLAVRAATGLSPLSVSADRIAHPAMRCAALLAELGRGGEPIDRGGGGVIVEVYPAASLKIWGLTHRGYKRAAGRPGLARLVDDLLAAAPWLDLGPHEPLCRSCDDAFDAVIAALTAGAAARGLTTRPDADQAATAATEGWIALPTTPLSALRP